MPRHDSLARLAPVGTLAGFALTIAGTAAWYAYIARAKRDTLAIGRVLSLPMTHGVWAALPGFTAFTLAAAVLLSLLALLSAFWRAADRRALEKARSSSPSRRWPALSVPTSILLVLLALWLAAVTAVTGVWAAGGLIMDRASLDGAVTLEDVDPAVRELIRSASRGAVDPTKTGFFVEVGPNYPGAPPPRRVDIGQTTCGLFCFVMARALMADEMECTCNATKLLAVHRIAAQAWRRRLAPAVVASAIAVVGVALLLLDSGARWGAARSERRLLGGGGGGVRAGRGKLLPKSSTAASLAELNVDPSSSPTKANGTGAMAVDIVGDARGAGDQDAGGGVVGARRR